MGSTTLTVTAATLAVDRRDAGESDHLLAGDAAIHGDGHVQR